MRRLIVSLAASSLLATVLLSPAAAQGVTEEQLAAATSAIEAADLSDDAYQNLWCGAAFGMVVEGLTSQGNTADVAEVEGLQNAVFEKAAIELLAEGMDEDEFSTLATHFFFLAVSQTTAEGGVADYSQEECIAAAE